LNLTMSVCAKPSPWYAWRRCCCRLRRCTCPLWAGLCSLAAIFVIRKAISSLHGCEMLEHASIWPAQMTMHREWFWSMVHWAGARNVFTVFRWLMPGYSKTHVAALPHGPNTNRRCALTLDDAVGQNSTKFELLLDILDEHTVPATIFIISDAHSQNITGRKLIRRASSAGHELGNHGVLSAPMIHLSKEEFNHSISEWEEFMRSVLQDWPSHKNDMKWFRPPQGLMNSRMEGILEARGYRTVLGDVYSDDAVIYDAKFHKDIITSSTCDGSVLILHLPTGHTSDQTFEILHSTIPSLKGRGFTFVRLTELFAQESHDNAHMCGQCTICTAVLVLMPVMVLVTVVCCVCRRCRLQTQHCLSWRRTEDAHSHPHAGAVTVAVAAEGASMDDVNATENMEKQEGCPSAPQESRAQKVLAEEENCAHGKHSVVSL